MADKYSFANLTPLQVDYLRGQYEVMGLPNAARTLNQQSFDELPLQKRINLFVSIGTPAARKEIDEYAQRVAAAANINKDKVIVTVPTTVAREISAEENAEINRVFAEQKATRDRLNTQITQLLAPENSNSDQNRRSFIAEINKVKSNQDPLPFDATNEEILSRLDGFADPDQIIAIGSQAIQNPTPIVVAANQPRITEVSIADASSADASRAQRLQSEAQVTFVTAQETAASQFLKSQGISVTGQTTVSFKDGVATITVPDGKSIRVPADEYNALVYKTEIDVQLNAEINRGFAEWQEINGANYATPEQARAAFNTENTNRFLANEPPLYNVPDGINTSLYAKGQQTADQLFIETRSLDIGGVDLTVAQSSPVAGQTVTGRDLTDEDRRLIDRTDASTADATVSATPTTTPKPPTVAPEPVTTATASKIEEPSKPATNVVIVENGADSNSGTASGTANKTINIRPNPLDGFTSYTYGLSLHMMTRQEFNSMVTAGAANPRHTLIASAGRQDYPRDPNWNENFFFDNLKMTTIIGLNSQAPGSNMIDMSFTIIEPMGLSLLDRLLVTTKNIGEQNHLSVPYLLQIDFFDSEKGAITKLRKWLPIRLIECKIKVGLKGSEYQFRAVPFSHSALMDTVVSTPVNFEVSAKTLSEFFKPGLSAKPQASTIQASNTSERSNTNSETQPTQPSALKISSYVDGYNSWNQAVYDAKIKQTGAAYQNNGSVKSFTKVFVEFDEKIISGGETIIDPSTQRTSNVPMGGGGRDSSGAAQAVDAQATVNFGMDRGRFMIPAGTHITAVINKVMESSDYIRRQVGKNKQPTTGTPKTELNWWKIIPRVILQDYNPATQKWACEITYYVKVYAVKNTQNPEAPKYRPTRADVVKDYNYLYTGLNTSVIDLQLDFDFLYYTSINVFKGARSGPTGDAVTNPADNTDSPASGAATLNVNPVTLNFQADDLSRNNSLRARTDELSFVISNISQNLYSGSRGDMLNITMKINGDPEFIKQDDLYISPAIIPTYDGGVQLFNGSIGTDSNELMVWLNVRVPVDYSEKTGGLAAGNNATSVFAGVYRVLSVENEFRNGQFTQALNMIRYHDQDPITTQSFERKEKVTGLNGLDAAPVVTATNSELTSDAIATAGLSAEELAQAKNGNNVTELADTTTADIERAELLALNLQFASQASGALSELTSLITGGTLIG